MGERNAPFEEGPLERPNWFEGRVLTSGDLDRQQTYVRERMRRRNRLLHGWGVSTGLDVWQADGLTLAVTPGFALDASGNEIIVSEETEVDVRDAGLAEPGITHWLAIRWDECPSGAVPAPWPGEPELAAAWREDFEIQLLDRQPDEAAAAAPWLALATIVWDGETTLTIDTSVRRPLGPAARLL